MLDPIELLTDTLIPVLRSMPELVATVNSATDIYTSVWSYPESVQSLFMVLPKQPTPSILVAHRSTNVAGARGNGIEHTYSLFLRPVGNVGPMFMALRDGIPTVIRTAAGLVPAAGSKFKLAQIHYQCRIPIVSGISLQSMLVTEQTFLDYYEVPLVLAERGLDT